MAGSMCVSGGEKYESIHWNWVWFVWNQHFHLLLCAFFLCIGCKWTHTELGKPNMANELVVICENTRNKKWMVTFKFSIINTYIRSINILSFFIENADFIMTNKSTAIYIFAMRSINTIWFNGKNGNAWRTQSKWNSNERTKDHNNWPSDLMKIQTEKSCNQINWLALSGRCNNQTENGRILCGKSQRK